MSGIFAEALLAFTLEDKIDSSRRLVRNGGVVSEFEIIQS